MSIRGIGRHAGFALVEVLAALLLASIGVAGLAAAAAAAVRHVQLARERSIAVALAADRLDVLRAGARTAGRDEFDLAGSRYAVSWRSTGGRGGAVQLHVEVAWAGGRVRLDGGAFP